MASIEHRLRDGNETWRVVWRQDVDGARRKQQKTFTDPRDAEKFARLVEDRGNRWPVGYEPAPTQPARALTFGQWAQTAVDRRTRANERTKSDYRRDLANHFHTLERVPLDQLDGGHVTAWLEDRQAAGLSDKTVRNLHGFASSLLVDALAQHPPLVAHNPFARKLGELATVRTEEMTFLTPQEFDLVLGHVRDEYRPLIRLLFATGLRFGEATALTARDVDLLGKRKTLTVTKAWKRTGPSEYVVGEPKTRRSRRTLGLSSELVELLAPIWSQRRGDELLFAGPHGLRLPHSEVYKRGWAPAVARARVCPACYEPQRTRRNPNERPRIPAPCDHDGVLEKAPRIHDLRHSHVAWLISEGVGLPAISRRLGHSSITITMDRYGHLDPSSLDDAINQAVDRALVRR
jgi:integrase